VFSYANYAAAGWMSFVVVCLLLALVVACMMYIPSATSCQQIEDNWVVGRSLTQAVTNPHRSGHEATASLTVRGGDLMVVTSPLLGKRCVGQTQLKLDFT
jgi:hypothetical protein